MARQTVAMTASCGKGIWVGKRSLGELPVGLSITASMDVYHWALMIDGTVYHVVGDEKENGLEISVEITDSKTTIDSFVWHLVKRQNTESKDALGKFAKEYNVDYDLLYEWFFDTYKLIKIFLIIITNIVFIYKGIQIVKYL